MLMDLYPTFLELAGAQIHDGIDGMSFLPELMGARRPDEDRCLFWVRREGGNYGGQAYYAARKGDYKILQNTPHEAFQFFHLGNDPFETDALESSGNQEYNELRGALMDHIRESGSIPWQAAPRE